MSSRVHTEQQPQQRWRHQQHNISRIILTLLALAGACARSAQAASTRATSATSANIVRLEAVSLDEEPPIGTLVVDVAARLGVHSLGDYKYRFYSPHSAGAHYFLIDQLTGQVRTQRSLDREYLCETRACGPCLGNNNCTLTVEIVATSSSSISIQQQQQLQQQHLPKQHQHKQKFISFDVVVEDANEFAPAFRHRSLVINVSESVPAGFSVPLEPAVDRDSRPTRIHYSIEPIWDVDTEVHTNQSSDRVDERRRVQRERLHAKLALVQPSGHTATSVDNKLQQQQQQLSLVFREPLDYESEKEIRFRLIASDASSERSGSSSSGSSECVIRVQVTDVNDNLPVFDAAEYEYRLSEEAARAGTRLIRVHATDRDEGVNALVRYELLDRTLHSTSSSSSHHTTGYVV